MAIDITIIGADGTRLDVAGRNAGRQGIILAAGQVKGIHDAPITTEWASAATEVGGRSKGTSYPVRDITLGFHAFGDDPYNDGPALGIEELDPILRKCFTSELDPWDPTEKLARIFAKSKRDLRMLSVQMSDTVVFDPDFDPTLDDIDYTNRSTCCGLVSRCGPVRSGSRSGRPQERRGRGSSLSVTRRISR